MDDLENILGQWVNLVRGLPNLKYNSEALCEACQKGNFSKPSFKSKNVVSSSKPLELLHIDLFGPVKTEDVKNTRRGVELLKLEIKCR